MLDLMGRSSMKISLLGWLQSDFCMTFASLAIFLNSKEQDHTLPLVALSFHLHVLSVSLISHFANHRFYFIFPLHCRGTTFCSNVWIISGMWYTIASCNVKPVMYSSDLMYLLTHRVNVSTCCIGISCSVIDSELQR